MSTWSPLLTQWPFTSFLFYFTSACFSWKSSGNSRFKPEQTHTQKKQTEKHTNVNYSYLSITLKGPKSVLFSTGRELSTAQLPAVDTLVIITSNMAKLPTTKGSQEPIDPGPECRKCYFANLGQGNAFRVWFQSGTVWDSQDLEIIIKPRETEVLNIMHIQEKAGRGMRERTNEIWWIRGMEKDVKMRIKVQQGWRGDKPGRECEISKASFSLGSTLFISFHLWCMSNRTLSALISHVKRLKLL